MRPPSLPLEYRGVARPVRNRTAHEDNVPVHCRLLGVSQNALRVVIAEDEALIRLDLKEMLEEEGYVVVAEARR